MWLDLKKYWRGKQSKTENMLWYYLYKLEEYLGTKTQYHILFIQDCKYMQKYEKHF